MFFYRMFTFLSLILSTTSIPNDADLNVEVFDIAQERVILQVTSEEIIQTEATEILQKVDGVFPKVQPIPRDGLLVKIALEPSVYVENEWFVDLVDELIIFYTAEDEPYVLLFDQENRTYFLTIKNNSLRLLLYLLNSRNQADLAGFAPD